MPLSKLDEIRKLLESCDLDEISTLRNMMDDASSLVQMVHLHAGSMEATNMRSEKRIPYDSSATVTRMTGIRPKEKVRFNAELKDVSRSGLCLIIEGRFIPSRLIKVQFETPVGKNKEVVLEVVRVKDLHFKHDDSLRTEIGCKAIDYQSANKLIIKDRKISAIREKISRHEKVLILVVGDFINDNDQFTYDSLRSKGYNVRKCFSVHQALASSERTQAQLVVLCNGSKLKYDQDFITGFRYRPQSLASIAIVDNEADRRKLNRAGIDECTTSEALADYLENVVEAAIIGHELRLQANAQRKQILLVGGDGLTRNSMKDIIGADSLQMVYCSNSDESEKYGIEEFEMVFAYYDSENPLEFMRVLELYYANTVIAICDSPLDGRDAIVRGAADYICTPIESETVNAVLVRDTRQSHL